MKVKSKILFALFTIIAVITGFALPNAVLTYRDKNADSQREQYRADAVKFQSSFQISEYLQLIGYGYTRVDLNQGQVNGASDIYHSALDVLERLADCDIGWDEVKPPTYHRETPFLAVGSCTVQKNDNSDTMKFKKSTSEKAVTAVIWECVLVDRDGNQIIMLIDDAKRKMLSFSIRLFQEQITEEYVDISLESAKNLENKLTDFFSDYYDMDMELIHLPKMEEKYISFTDASGNSILLPVFVSFHAYSFNSPEFNIQ